MKPMPILKAETICFSYGSQAVLKNINLEVTKGEMLGIIGPNGAGKTTLLKVLAGILKPAAGSVYLDSTDIQALPLRERARKIAMVSQQPALPFGFTALEIVTMGRNPHLGLLEWEGPKDLELAREAMEVTGTIEFTARSITSLSGGERQRVFIARALAQQAPLLFLDEPTAHLDLNRQSEIMDLIAHIQREKQVSVVASMHDLTLAGQYCDRITALVDGQISAQGAAHDVLTTEVLSRAFGASVFVIKHPFANTPVVLTGGPPGLGTTGLTAMADKRRERKDLIIGD
ncbi:MAG: ABC transporter ATP-binding protein [Acidobacteriota bacterium]